jgi:hypothetical protein
MSSEVGCSNNTLHCAPFKTYASIVPQKKLAQISRHYPDFCGVHVPGKRIEEGKEIAEEKAVVPEKETTQAVEKTETEAVQQQLEKLTPKTNGVH